MATNWTLREINPILRQQADEHEYCDEEADTALAGLPVALEASPAAFSVDAKMPSN